MHSVCGWQRLHKYYLFLKPNTSRAWESPSEHQEMVLLYHENSLEFKRLFLHFLIRGSGQMKVSEL